MKALLVDPRRLIVFPLAHTRAGYNGMDDLVASIKENGLMQPPVVRIDEEGRYVVITGNRRVHACRIIGCEQIPVVEITDSPPAALF